MDVKHEVGDTAGKIWHLLNDHGPQTLTQLKKRLNGTDELLPLALGWLAREDKVEITSEKKNLRVHLK